MISIRSSYRHYTSTVQSHRDGIIQDV